jgi:hypothetical protein
MSSEHSCRSTQSSQPQVRMGRESPSVQLYRSALGFSYHRPLCQPHQCPSARVQLQVWEPETSGVDALALDWVGENNWINAQFRLIDKIIQSGTEATIVAPRWPCQPWFQRLQTITIQRPLYLPKNNLNIQTTSATAEVLWNRRWRLYAWRVSGRITWNFQMVWECRLNSSYLAPSIVAKLWSPCNFFLPNCVFF